MNGTKGTADNTANNTLAQLSEQLVNEGAPFRQGLQGAGMDILKTGGTQSMIPFISQMIQQMKSALTKTMVDTQGRLGMTRSAGTPFGNRLLAQTELQGQSDIAQAGPNASMQFLQSLIPFSQGQTQTGIGGLSSAAQANTGVLESQNRAYADIMSAMIGAGTQAGIAAGKALPCWIAEALYGPQAVETWLARWWVLFHAPRWVVRLYQRYGRQIASSPLLCRYLRPLFEWIIQRARREFYL